jgi:ElaB/YqjD/DUF883 family membrane-anchored ribosome-binding protein
MGTKTQQVSFPLLCKGKGLLEMATYATKVQNMSEKDLENQIAALRKQLASISKSLSDKGYEIADDGNSAFETVKKNGQKAARFVGDEAQLVAEKARENPIATVAIISAVAGLGLLAGLGAYRR